MGFHGQTDNDERLYRACERDVAFGIEQLFGYPLPADWQEPFNRIEAETYPPSTPASRSTLRNTSRRIS